MKKILFLDGCKCIDPITMQEVKRPDIPMTILPKKCIELEGKIYPVYESEDICCIYLPCEMGFMLQPNYQLIEHLYELIKEKKEDCQ